jgi:hypothetical protein
MAAAGIIDLASVQAEAIAEVTRLPEDYPYLKIIVYRRIRHR